MSTLIITANTKKGLKYIEKIVESNENIRVNIFNNIDILCYNDKDLKLSTELFRDIINKLNEKSLNLSNKYLIISNFNRATVEAQNAFLKTLEESSKQIYLISRNKSGILETVLSRVFEINLKSKISYNKIIQKLLEKILIEKEISNIKLLTSGYPLDKILINLEVYLGKNKDKFENKNIITALNKLYLLKKRSLDVSLNSEIQITNVLLSLIN